jgi:hypothetical protein
MRLEDVRFAATRREALLLGMGALLAGGTQFPSNALAEGALSSEAVATLRAYADVLVPGAANAGVTDFVAAMLASDDHMLFYKYMDFPLPPLKFYAAGLAALNEFSLKQKQRPYSALEQADMKALAGALLDPAVSGWGGPPAFLFYFCVRNDALDVVYGPAAAYERLNIPYMAHIIPPTNW